MKTIFFRVVMIDYPMQHEVLYRTFDNFKDADNYAFGMNMNRITSKCEFEVRQSEVEV